MHVDPQCSCFSTLSAVSWLDHFRAGEVIRRSHDIQHGLRNISRTGSASPGWIGQAPWLRLSSCRLSLSLIRIAPWPLSPHAYFVSCLLCTLVLVIRVLSRISPNPAFAGGSAALDRPSLSVPAPSSSTLLLDSLQWSAYPRSSKRE
jgi:hypothetical protein